MSRMVLSAILPNIPKNTQGGVFAIELIGLTYACLAGAFGPKLELLCGIAVLPKILFPVAAAASVLLLRNGQRTSNERIAGLAVADILRAGVAVVGTQLLLSFLWPYWAMPRWAPTQGGFVGFCFLISVRTAFPAGPPVEFDDPEVSHAELTWRLTELNRTSSRGILVALLAALALFVLSVAGISNGGPALRQAGVVFVLVFALWLGACAFWAAFSNRRKNAAPMDSYRLALRGQCAFLAGSWTGLMTLLLPGLVLVLYGTHVYEFVAVIYLLFLAEVLRRSRAQYVREIRLLPRYQG